MLVMMFMLMFMFMLLMIMFMFEANTNAKKLLMVVIVLEYAEEGIRRRKRTKVATKAISKRSRGVHCWFQTGSKQQKGCSL